MKPAVFLLADEGYPGYAGMVLAPDKHDRGHPAAVKAFVDATAAGWKSYLYGDPKPGDALILKGQSRHDPGPARCRPGFRLRDKGIVLSGDAKTGGIGAMTDARWAQFFKVASDGGVYPKTLDYKSAYTLAFLPPLLGRDRLQSGQGGVP